MNTYNENLHSSVVASLQSQDLEQKKLDSQVNASLFTLYYAEGAAITAQEKLELAKEDQLKKAAVKKQAVDCSNISNNLLASANQSTQYIKQSVSNTAVSASNIQVAANAVLRLAGDLGSIFSIVNAANFESEIYTHTVDAVNCINDTAYAAEALSEAAMEASVSTSEVTMPTVLDKSKATNTTMAGLLKVVSSDFDTASQNVANQNSILAAASVKEKAAEGALEDVSVDYTAANSAYNSINNQLNLNLNVTPVKKQEYSSFDVEFNTILSPYLNPVETTKSDKYYPVQDYYVIVVKDNKKTTFSITEAENIVLNKKQDIDYVKITNFHAIPSSTGYVAKQRIDIYQENDKVMVDSDGEDITLGTEYVVFVYAAFLPEYKRKINNFDEFLSAPSPKFSLTNLLKKADYKSIKIIPFNEIEDKKHIDGVKHVEIIKKMANDFVKNTGAQPDQVMLFDVNENMFFNVDYRCMFLPQGHNVPKGLLSQSLLNALNREISKLEEIADELDPQISEAEMQKNNLAAEAEKISLQLEDAKNKLDQAKKGKPKDAKEIKRLTDLNKKLEKQLKSVVNDLEETKNLYESLTGSLRDSLSIVSKKHYTRLRFFFNETLAEQVPAGNYTMASSLTEMIPISKSKKKHKRGSVNTDVDATTTWVAFIGPATTDNFGNQLINNNKYVPVILSVSAETEDMQPEFTNVLSDFNRTKHFTYQEQINTNL